MTRYGIGYTQGVYDMFHIGHLNLLERAKEQCETLIVGVNADDLVIDYKHKKPIICQEDRMKIVAAIRVVDKVILADTLDKMKMHSDLHFDALFIGNDWQGNPRWEETAAQMSQIGVDTVFLPYTAGITSTQLRVVKDERVPE